VGLQKDQNVPHAGLRPPAPDDAIRPLALEARHLVELLWGPVQHLADRGPEPLNEPAGENGPHTIADAK
jgi:hypothetical protein